MESTVMKERQVDKCVNHWNKVASQMMSAKFFKDFNDNVEKLKDDPDMNFRADVLMKALEKFIQERR